MPATDVPDLARAFGSTLFLPSSLPSGFIFSDWEVKRHDVDTGGRNSLFLLFGRDGPTLDWGVYEGTDTFGLDCPTKKSPFARKKPFAVIRGIRIFLIVGIHGGSAWRCVAAHAVGNPKPLEIELWYDIRLDGPAMRRQVSEIVAAAELVTKH